MAGGPALSPRSGTVTARSGGCCASHAAPEQPRARGTALGAKVPPHGPLGSPAKLLLAPPPEPGRGCGDRVSHMVGPPRSLHGAAAPSLSAAPQRLPRSSARCRQPGERGGPRFPRSLPRPRCQAAASPRGAPWGRPTCASLSRHPPAGTSPPSPSSSSATLPGAAGCCGSIPGPSSGAPVPGAGQGSEAGVWALPITALPRAGNSAAGPALPQRRGCRGPRGHGAGDPLPTSMSLLCYGPKCLLLPQTCLWPLIQPHPDSRWCPEGWAERSNEGVQGKVGWQALGGWQRAKGQGVQEV